MQACSFKIIADVIRQARQAVNTAMVQSDWQVGHLIVQHDQQGKQRAAYGKQQLSKQLTLEFGKGYFLCGTTTAHPHRESGCYVQVGTDE